MTRSTIVLSAAVAGALAAAVPAAAQAANPTPLAVGARAPDFTVPGATRYGVLGRPVRLSDFRGKVVVLAFFFKARTKG